MPKIYHTHDPKKLKKLLEEKYSINFGFELNKLNFNVIESYKIQNYLINIIASIPSDQIKLQKAKKEINIKGILNAYYNDYATPQLKDAQTKIEKFLEFKPDKYTDDDKETTSEMQNLFQRAIELCNNTLPVDHKDFFNIDIDTECDLFCYVITDAFMNLDKYLFDNIKEDEKYFKKMNHFIRQFKIDFMDENYNKYYETAIKNFLIQKDFALADKVKKDDLYEVNDRTPVCKYLYKIFGLLTYKNLMDPYRNISSNTENPKFKSLNMKNLKSFFIDKMYNWFSNVDQFKDPNQLRHLLGLYYLDQIYDFRNMIYIAKKLEELQHTNYNINQYNKSELIDLFYKCLLIPDVFSKRYYIDTMFNVLKSSKTAFAKYIDSKTCGNVLAFFDESTKYEVRVFNLKYCEEYLSYITRIYLPVLSACFYVLLFEKFETYETVYEKLACIMLNNVDEYYSDYLANINSEFEDLEKYVDNNLVLLYNAIRENIFFNEETYSSICDSLKLTSIPRGISLRMTDALIKAKTEPDVNNMTDPCGNLKLMNEENILHIYNRTVSSPKQREEVLQHENELRAARERYMENENRNWEKKKERKNRIKNRQENQSDDITNLPD